MDLSAYFSSYGLEGNVSPFSVMAHFTRSLCFLSYLSQASVAQVCKGHYLVCGIYFDQVLLGGC